MILLLAVLLGCANAVDMPVRQSFAIEMVGPRGHRQRRRAQLGDVQRRAGHRARPSAGLAIGAFGVAAGLRHQRR